jgi:F420-dependent oxidoreductase-like protein
MDRPVRVGVCLPHGWRSDLPDASPPDQWAYVSERARKVEALGYDSVWLVDHLQPAAAAADPLFECWTAMAALAVTTRRVRLGQMVTCTSYRPPALLAKMAACIDAMSAGRLDVGIGAGWFQPEYAAWGYDFPGPGDRVDMLAEAIQVLRAIWTTAPASFHGCYYRIDGVQLAPRPVQRPHPPLWVGSSGERKGLRTVAAYADYWSVTGERDEIAAKADVLARHCDDVGRDPSDIGRAWKGDVVIAETEPDAARLLDRILSLWAARGVTRYGTESSYRRSHLVGTPTQIVEQMARYRAVGCTVFVCDFFDVDGTAVELFADEVLPRL